MYWWGEMTGILLENLPEEDNMKLKDAYSLEGKLWPT